MIRMINRDGVSAVLGILGMSLLVGCGNDAALGEQPVISGQFPTWTHGSSAVIKTSISSGATTTVLTTAPVDASGAFSLTLPTGSQVASTYERVGGGYFCKGNPPCPVTSSPEIVQRATFNFSVLLQPTDANEHLVLYLKSPVGDNHGNVFYYYYDQDIDITGTVPYSTPPGDLTVNIHARKGWNIEVNDYTASGLNTATRVPPADYKWIVVP